MTADNRVTLYYTLRREAECNGCPEDRVTDELERLIFETKDEPETLPLYLDERTRPWISRRILCLVADYHGVPWPEFPEPPKNDMPDPWGECEPDHKKATHRKLHPWGADALCQSLKYHRSQLTLLRGILRQVDMAQVPGSAFRVLTGPSMDAVMRSMTALINQVNREVLDD